MVCLAALGPIGCETSEGTWQKRYSTALRAFRQGYTDSAFQLSDAGYRGSGKRYPVWGWKFRILEAQVRLRQRMPEQALLLLSGELPASSPVEVSVRKKVIQGQALCGLNKAGEATAVLNEAENIIPPVERDLAAELAFARATCALYANRSAAQRYYLQSAELAHGGDPFIEASALLGLGYVLLQAERYDEAIERFNEALPLADSPFIREKALGNLGFSYSQLGDWKRATSLSQQAESLAAEIKNDRDREKCLIDLGLEHFTQLEYSQAEASYSKALSLARQLSNNTDDVANSLHHLTQLALRTHDLDKAEGYFQQAQTLGLKGKRRLYLALDEAEIAKARDDFSRAEALLKPLLLDPGSSPLLHWQMESDLADIYVAQDRFAQAEEMLRDAVQTALKARLTVSPEYRISFLDQAPFYDRYVSFLVSRGRNADALRIAELGRSPTLAEALDAGGHDRPGAVRLRRIQRTLRRHQVVLAYWLAERESYLWAITPSQTNLFKLPAETEIQAALESYEKQILDHGDLGDKPLGQELYEMLVRPAEKLVPKGSDVIIVPHRKLYNFNFETLIVPGAQPHYWIEDVGIQNAGFLAALASPKRMRSGDGKKLLLVGAPIEADPEFPTLKHAAEEMEKVEGHFLPAEEKVVGGAEAVPEAYSSSHPDGFRFVHFVTHGTANVEKPLESAIILSRGSDRAYKLYAREIMATPQHAELVTISACYSAGARAFSGEGLVGLAWAFMRAGAHQVIAALWEVDDASTPQLMDDFYGELTQGKSPAEALRDAKLKMLHSSDFHRHPYYWASLQLYTGS